MAFTFKPYMIQCITNLHAGSGDTNYGVIDKLVQRDPVTGHPTIHASSLKGALREHFEKKQGTKVNTNTVFGKEAKDGNDSETGDYKFLSADLLALPVRCTHRQFVLAFEEGLPAQLNSKMNIVAPQTGSLFQTSQPFASNAIYLDESVSTEIVAEDTVLAQNKWFNPFSINLQYNPLASRFAVFSENNFKNLSKNLPVIARNNIEDGTSNNLWYEEIVPHQTLFLTFIGSANAAEGFDQEITADLVQIGANATVGYGLCKFYELKP